jgi:hypothetical protein
LLIVSLPVIWSDSFCPHLGGAVDDFAGVAEIVIAQLPDPFLEIGRVQDFHKGLDTFFEESRLGQHHIETLPGNRDEGQAQDIGDGGGGNAHIGLSGNDGEPHLVVGVDMAVITMDCLCGDAKFLQMIVQKDPGAGAGLTVDQPDAGIGQIFETFDMKRVSRRSQEPQLPVKQVDDDRLELLQMGCDVGDIVLPAFRV